MITELSFTNFKSWESVDAMRLAPITGLSEPTVPARQASCNFFSCSNRRSINGPGAGPGVWR